MNQKVILLFGLPRSGTTWIGKIFDSHPDTLYRHEPDSWGLLNEVPLLPPVQTYAEHRAVVRSFTSRLPSMKATKVSASLPIFAKSYYPPWRLKIRRLAISVAKIGAKVLGEWPVPALVPAHVLGSAPVVWKSIESVGRLGVALRSLDNARAILIIRHPCGYVASVLRGESGRKFTGDVRASEDYGILERLMETEPARARGLKLEDLRSLHPVERLAWRWALFNEKAMDDIAGRDDGLLIRYEDVCAAPIDKAKEMFAFAGLPWDAQTAGFIEHSTSSERTAYYSVIKNPLKAANHWRDDLAKEDIQRILKVVADTAPGRLYLEDPE